MDLTGIKPVIISCGVGGWYAAGIDRMERSLIYHGYGGDMLFWRDEYPEGCPPHNENPYAFKIYAFREAFKRGYKIVVWLDCSFWAIKNPMPILDIINEHGLFAFRSGYNCAETCPDNLLYDVGITRDVAEQIPETATGIVGINIDNPNGKKVFEYWEDFCERGLFINSRVHNSNESADPRFKFGRQDQSAFSMALYKAGVEFNYVDYVSYYDHSNPLKNSDKAFFYIGGL
ncbi:MAG TPA: hypothetical protein PKO16_06170 [Bacteroidia bacterium]|nr:hypothetical protein [Bacteroidia bacterium]